MKKYIFFFTLMLLCIVPLSASAQQQFSYSFESPSDAQMWSGGEYDDSNAFESGYSIFVSNPFGEIRNEKVTHVLDYSPTIELEGGKVYTLKGRFFDPLASSRPSPHASATRSPGANTVIVNVSGAGDSWAEFSTTFFAGESGEYNLSLHFSDIYADFGIFVDELVLSETPCILSYLEIRGSTQIVIPASGSIKNYYRPYIVTPDNQKIDILTSSNIHFNISEVPGISFNPRTYELTISSDAIPDTTVSLSCAVRNFASLPPTSLNVKLTDTILGSDFTDDENIQWESSADVVRGEEDTNAFISVPTNDYGDFGYFTTITHTDSHVLIKGVMYVIRARVKTDNSETFTAIHASNSAQLKNNTVYFNIKDISGEEWTDVFAAFIPNESGVYNIALNLCSVYDCHVFVDDIVLRVESPSAEYITLHAPGNIALPNTVTKYPVSALLRDQLGNVITSDDIDISIENSPEKIDFNPETKEITVFPDTPAGTYTLKAEYHSGNVSAARLNFSVSHDFIGDGSFEETIPNQWWMVSSPHDTDFYMRHDGSSIRALINCKGNYCVLLNNSYVHLSQGAPYVFNSAFSTPVDCTATLFLEKLDSSVLPLAQTHIEAGTSFNSVRSPELFLSEEDAVGRLFIYIEATSSESFSIYADNISLKSASIVAVNPRITGIPYVNGAVEANFILFNSITGSSDSSACSVNWYVSDTINGPYKEVPSGGKNIYFDIAFLNKYVCFEVTPVCPVTGFSGIPVRSLPFLITYDPSDGSSALPMFTPIVKKYNPTDDFFSDIDDHWGREYINTLAQYEIINGKSANKFAPSDNVTRAEFAKMLSIAFSINTVADLPSFEDVARTDWHYQYVTALHLAGIVNGTSPTSFAPDGTLSRQEAVVMMVRLYEKATGTKAQLTDDRFSDWNDVSDWAQESASKAVFLNLLQGNPDGTFAPEKELTRAEAAALICRLSEIIRK